MEQQKIKVFNTVCLQRIGLQNKVIRSLRDLGCLIKSTQQDMYLTIEIAPESCRGLVKKASCISRVAGKDAITYAVLVDSVRVIWREVLH